MEALLLLGALFLVSRSKTSQGQGTSEEPSTLDRACQAATSAVGLDALGATPCNVIQGAVDAVASFLDTGPPLCPMGTSLNDCLAKAKQKWGDRFIRVGPLVRVGTRHVVYIELYHFSGVAGSGSMRWDPYAGPFEPPHVTAGGATTVFAGH